MEKKKQPNFSFNELEALTSGAVTYCLYLRYTMTSVTRIVYKQ